MRGDVEVDQLVAGKVWKKYGALPIAIAAVGVALKGEEAECTSRIREFPREILEGENAKSCFLL